MKMLKITLQGKTYEVGVEMFDGTAPATSAPAPVYVAPAPVIAAAPAPAPVAPAPAPAAPVSAPMAGGHSVTSPMPGLVFKIGVTVGQQVAKDQQLLVMDAMKMESPIYAPCAGTIAAILVKESEAVVEGQVLIQIS